MQQATGANTVTGVGKETTYGVTPASPDGRISYMVSGVPGKKQKLIQPNTLTPSREKARSVLGNITDDGTLEVELNATSMGLLFEQVMGKVVHAGSGPYTHTYTVDKLNSSLWMSVDESDVFSGSGRYFHHNGIRVNEMTINLAAEGLVKVSFGLIGRDAVPASAPIDATLTDNGFFPFSQFEAVIEEGGVEVANVKSGTIKIANGMSTDTYVVGGQGKRAAAAEGQADISGALTVLYTDQVLLNKALSRASSSLKLTYAFGDGTGTAGNESIELLVSNLDYEAATPEISGPGGREVTLNFMGFKVTGDPTLQITEKNMIATF